MQSRALMTSRSQVAIIWRVKALLANPGSDIHLGYFLHCKRARFRMPTQLTLIDRAQCGCSFSFIRRLDRTLRK